MNLLFRWKTIITTKEAEKGCSNNDWIEAVNQEKPCDNKQSNLSCKLDNLFILIRVLRAIKQKRSSKSDY